MNKCKVSVLLYSVLSVTGKPVDIEKIEANNVEEMLVKVTEQLNRWGKPIIASSDESYSDTSSNSSHEGRELEQVEDFSTKQKNFFHQYNKHKVFGYFDIDETLVKSMHPAICWCGFGKYPQLFAAIVPALQKAIYDQNLVGPYSSKEGKLEDVFLRQVWDEKKNCEVTKMTKDFEQFLFANVFYENSELNVLDLNWPTVLKGLGDNFRYFSAAHPSLIERRATYLNKLGFPVHNPLSETNIYKAEHKMEDGEGGQQVIAYYQNIEHHGPLTDKVDWFKTMKQKHKTILLVDDKKAVIEGAEKSLREGNQKVKRAILVHFKATQEVEKVVDTKLQEEIVKKGSDTVLHGLLKKWKEWIRLSVKAYLEDLSLKGKLHKVDDFVKKVADEVQNRINTPRNLLDSKPSTPSNGSKQDNPLALHQIHTYRNDPNSSYNSNDSESSHPETEKSLTASPNLSDHDETLVKTNSNNDVVQQTEEIITQEF